MREILFRGKSVYTGKWAVSVCPHGVMRSGHLCDDFMLETVGQFTGLTDKNGKKIFEGDIGKSIDGVFLVRWSEEKCAFVMDFYDYPKEELYLEEMWDDAEIIGNIHDNPELLEGE